MAYYAPDLSGSLPEYQVVNDPYTLFITGQKIDFIEPIFKDSLAISLLVTPVTPLVEGVDWEVREDDIDYTAMSKCKNQDNGFNKLLLKSITIIRNIAGELRVGMSYQRLYPVTHKTVMDHVGHIELTPDLVADLLGRLAILEGTMQPMGNVIATPMIEPRLLPEDMHKERAGNLVTEVATVNVFQGENVIRPTTGSFFKDSVVIRSPEHDYTLKYGEDYIVIGVNHAKTRLTKNASGVYEFILVTYAYAGPLSVTTHAYGGEVTHFDMDAVYKSVKNVTTYLGSRTFLTPESLPTVGAFQMLVHRMTSMEDRVRSLLTGNPTYGDSTNGKQITRRLRANDANYHWWTIARLFTTDGSPDVVVADRAKFRINLVGGKLLSDVAVAVDIRQNSLPFTIDSSGVVHDIGYTLFGTSTPHEVLMPKFRVIYNKSESDLSGIYLQIGLSLPALQDTLAIEDTSGIESCWIFLEQGNEPTLPEDDAIVLPGGQVWDSFNVNSIAHVAQLPMPKPYRAWEGTLSLLTHMGSSDGSIPGSLLRPSFDLASIKSVELIFVNGDDVVIKSTADVIYANNHIAGDVIIQTGETVLAGRVMITPNNTGPNLPHRLTLTDLKVIVGPAPDAALRYVLVKV